MNILFEIVFAALAVAAPVPQPQFYYGADCVQENASASSPGGGNGIVLEGRSGAIIARDIVCKDRPAIFRALLKGFGGPVGEVYRWTGSAADHAGAIRITWEFRDDTVLCRDFALDHTVAGHRYLRQGTACLESDGNWHLH